MKDKYLSDGRKVVVENETTDGKFVVRTVFNIEDEYSGECFESESNNVIVVNRDQLCEKPPTLNYEKIIENIRNKISESTEELESLRIEVGKSHTELAKVKRELTDSDLRTARTINRLGKFIENPAYLIGYLLGEFTYIVVDEERWPTMVSFEDQYRKNLSFRFEDEGKRRMVLSVKNGDCWWPGVPCKSKEQALAVLKEKLKYAHMDRPGVMISEAAKHGIIVDQKYIDRHAEAKAKEKEKKRRELEAKIKDLGE